MWDFHDGIDLPASVGTAVHAVADGVIHRAGPANRTGPGKGFSSRHIVLRVVDPTDGEDDLFVVYLHLDRIAARRGAKANRSNRVMSLVRSAGRMRPIRICTSSSARAMRENA